MQTKQTDTLQAGIVTTVLFCLILSASCSPTPAPEKRELANEFYQNLLIAFAARNYDLVKTGLQKIEDAGLEDKRTCYLKAMVALHEQKPEQAITALKSALAFDPDYGDARNTLGSIYMQQKLLPAAETEFLSAANNSLYQTPEKAYHNLGKLYQLQNKHKQAQQCYIKAVELNQGYFPSHYELSQLYLNINKLEDAFQEIEKARQISPEHPGVWFYLAKIEKARGNQKQARHAFKQTIKLQPLGFFAKQANLELNLLK